ncbi:MAG: hypothetical protein EPO32_08650 [Anaerolineae bacterium]|nr:MAG: hypothetical protein EPO32_08650 [Anaerolineae bacterium]
MKKALLVYEKEYISKLPADLRALQRLLGIAGADDLFDRVPLSQVYVMLRAVETRLKRTGDESRVDRAEEDAQELGRPAPLLEALLNTQRLVIAGDPGAGKTTSLLYLAWWLVGRCAKAHNDADILPEASGFPDIPLPDPPDGPYIPMFFRLREIASELKSPANLRKLAVDRVNDWLARDIAEQMVDAWMDEDRLFFLFDGLDEVTPGVRGTALNTLRRYSDGNTELPLVVTSRGAGELYRPLVGVDGAGKVQADLRLYLLQSLRKREDQQAFVERWLTLLRGVDSAEGAGRLLDWARASGGVQKMCTNPLLLHMLIDLYARADCRTDALPVTRSRVYECYVIDIAWARGVGDGKPPLKYERAARLLEFIAWFLQIEGRPLSLEEFQERLTAYLEPDEDLVVALTFFSQRLRLLVPVHARSGHDQRYAFAHQTFQEFFVARRLAALWRERPDGPKWVMKKVLEQVWWRSEWREVILLLGAAVGAEPGEPAAVRDGERLLEWAEKWPGVGDGELAAHLMGEGVAPRSALAEAVFESYHRKMDLSSIVATGTRFLSRLQDALQEDNSWVVRQAAASALGLIGDTASVPMLREALNDDTEWVRDDAARALGQIGDPAAVPALLNTLRDDYLSVGEAAAWALKNIGDPSAIAGLRHALQDDNKNVRLLAAWALRELENPASEPIGGIKVTLAALALRDSLKNDNPQVRWEAAEDLGFISDPATVELLRDALNHPRWSVRQAAAVTLGNIGDSVATPALRAALRDNDPRVRQEVIEALGEIGDATVISDLVDALQENNNWLRRAAARALGNIGDAATVPALQVTLKDSDPSVRQAAARALQQIGHTAAVAALQEILPFDGGSTPQSVTWALEKLVPSVVLPPPILPSIWGERSGGVLRKGMSLAASLGMLVLAAAAVVFGGLLIKFITPDLIAQVWPDIAALLTYHPLWVVAAVILLTALVDWLRKRKS